MQPVQQQADQVKLEQVPNTQPDRGIQESQIFSVKRVPDHEETMVQHDTQEHKAGSDTLEVCKKETVCRKFKRPRRTRVKNPDYYMKKEKGDSQVRQLLDYRDGYVDTYRWEEKDHNKFLSLLRQQKDWAVVADAMNLPVTTCKAYGNRLRRQILMQFEVSPQDEEIFETISGKPISSYRLSRAEQYRFVRALRLYGPDMALISEAVGAQRILNIYYYIPLLCNKLRNNPDHNDYDLLPLLERGEFCNKWTQEEHERFCEAIRTHGCNYRQLMLAVGTKTRMQIMSYKCMLVQRIKKNKDVKNYDLIEILKSKDRQVWTKAEEEQFKALVKEHGFWGQGDFLVSHFKNRTKSQLSGLRHRLYLIERSKENPDQDLIDKMCDKHTRKHKDQTWSDKDEEKFLEAIEQIGKNWVMLAEYLGNRKSPEMCQKQWYRVRDRARADPNCPEAKYRKLLEYDLRSETSKVNVLKAQALRQDVKKIRLMKKAEGTEMLKKDEALIRLIEGQKHRLSRMEKKGGKKKKRDAKQKKEEGMDDTILGDDSFITQMEQSIVEKEENTIIVQDGMLRGNACDIQSTFFNGAGIGMQAEDCQDDDQGKHTQRSNEQLEGPSQNEMAESQASQESKLSLNQDFEE